MYSDTITGNLESSEETFPRTAGTTQGDFDLAHREHVEDLGDSHSQAHKLSDQDVQELPRIWRNHRRRDGHTAGSGGNVARTFCGV